MTTTRQQIFDAVFALWSDPTVVAAAAAGVKRNDVLPERLTAGQVLLVQQEGGDAPDPASEVLGIPAYVYDETVDVELAVQADEATARAAIDAAIAAVGAMVSNDRRLGGLVDDFRILQAPRYEHRAVAGALPFLVATVSPRLEYTLTDITA